MLPMSSRPKQTNPATIEAMRVSILIIAILQEDGTPVLYPKFGLGFQTFVESESLCAWFRHRLR
jgi:hypothetical protein